MRDLDFGFDVIMRQGVTTSVAIAPRTVQYAVT